MLCLEAFEWPSISQLSTRLLLKLLCVYTRLMGESNAVMVRRPRLRGATWEAICAAYMSTLTEEERQSGSIPATFEVSIIQILVDSCEFKVSLQS